MLVVSGSEGRIVLTVPPVQLAYIGPDLQGVGAKYSQIATSVGTTLTRWG